VADRLVYEAVRNKLEDFKLFEGEILKFMKDVSQGVSKAFIIGLARGPECTIQDLRPREMLR